MFEDYSAVHPLFPVVDRPEPVIAPAAMSADDIRAMYAMGLLDALLKDKTTKTHIIWATDTYQDFGPGYGRKDEISPDRLIARDVLKTRLNKRGERTRRHGEVFTPLWICEKMCAYAHKVLRGKDWQKYVSANVLEICCGEAPFLASRRDVTTGEFVPVAKRVGLLDHKLQVVGEKAQDEREWLEWAYKAFQAIYGYEFQGDNLLLARVNLLRTFEEYLWERWMREPSPDEYKKILNIIVWNIWQMDGLKGTIPYGKIRPKERSLNLFGDRPEEDGFSHPCLVYDWEEERPVEYLSLTSGK